MNILLTILLQAISVLPEEQAIVCHLPYTQICAVVEYDQNIHEAGRFASFAEEMLDIHDAVQTSDTTYRVTGIQCRTHTIADPNRTFKVQPIPGLDAQLISLTRDGIFRGYNIRVEEEPAKKKNTKSKPQVSPAEPVRLPEEAIVAESEREKAQAVQHAILQLRETRMFLLLGEAEHQPADGESLEVLLRNIDQQERSLTSLFTGRTTVRHLEKNLYYNPEESTQVIIGRFSETQGLVGENEEGTPIVLTIDIQPMRYQAEETPKQNNKKGPKPSPLLYNIPGSAHCLISLGDEPQDERDYPIAQAGIALPISEELLHARNYIYINTRTGNILTIHQ